ncbi:hypothetical protein BC628DRAFT_1423242 [Trametes gibbosa]|nr:hypothetical protein BC628DRAFT_934891 [Trametes gibbosa]KAI0820051.1 hypothetical protein BC628DRAFT_1423242 [Trametes gibbosa]
MFSNKFATMFTALVAAAAAVSAAPSDVIRPPITAPKAGDVWKTGSTQLVTWDTSNIVNPTGETGVILLGTLSNGDEDLDTSNPLAVGFAISAGAVNVTVPAVAAGDDYIVALFGDSGNISPAFTITN